MRRRRGQSRSKGGCITTAKHQQQQLGLKHCTKVREHSAAITLVYPQVFMGTLRECVAPKLMEVAKQNYSGESHFSNGCHLQCRSLCLVTDLCCSGSFDALWLQGYVGCQGYGRHCRIVWLTYCLLSAQDCAGHFSRPVVI